MQFAQKFSDKKVTTLKSTTLVAYPVQAILLHISLTKRQSKRDIGDILVGFLLVCPSVDEEKEEESNEDVDIFVYEFLSFKTVPLRKEEHVPRDSERREEWMRVVYEATKVVVRPLQDCKLKAFIVMTSEMVE